MTLEHLSWGGGFGGPTHMLPQRTWAANLITGGHLWGRRSGPVRIRSSCSISLAWPRCVCHKCTCAKWRCEAGSEDQRAGTVTKAQMINQ